MKQTMQKVKQLLDYKAMHPDAVITYQVSDMVLAGHSDASYISETKYRSRSGEYFFMYNNTSFPPNNGTLLVIDKIIKKVMSSSAEDELGALFVKCKEAIPSSQSLEKWCINNHQHQCRLIIQPHMAWSLTIYQSKD